MCATGFRDSTKLEFIYLPLYKGCTVLLYYRPPDNGRLNLIEEYGMHTTYMYT